MNIGATPREQALQNLQTELDRGPITDNEVTMSAKLGLPPRGLTDEGKFLLSQKDTGQSLEPDYGRQGLQNVSPVAELFGLGIGKIAANAVSKTKMYSDQVVDRINRFNTPNRTYHGGQANVGTLKTTYDRSIEGEKVTNTISDYSPFQAALYTAPKKVAEQYKVNHFFSKAGGSLYNIDISSATKIYNSNKPSKYMKEALRKEVEVAKEAGDGRRAVELKGLIDGKKYMTHVSPVQREFLEGYGYEGIKTTEPLWKDWPQAWTGIKPRVTKDKDKSATLLFRPEKYPAKESDTIGEFN